MTGVRLTACPDERLPSAVARRQAKWSRLHDVEERSDEVLDARHIALGAVLEAGAAEAVIGIAVARSFAIVGGEGLQIGGCIHRCWQPVRRGANARDAGQVHRAQFK